ncbi:MAG: RNA polymerase sigma-70 factor [Bacteroidales bacterium]|nr:RNA polymerase sigma-70 factor [Bacteroidales bacterium]
MDSLFKDIYKNHYTELCCFARRFLQSDEDAEEIVQEVIYRLWENKLQIDKIQSLRAYLYRAVHNKCLNVLNKLARENQFKDKAWVELKKLELSKPDAIHETELMEKYNQALELLPQRCKQVFELSRNEGKKNREIAEMLDISIKAVEANISRALQSLRIALKEYLTIELLLFFYFISNLNIGQLFSYLS